MKKVVEDIRKFWNYTKHSSSAELKSEVAGSFLSWLWWILDPLLYMLVYSFVAIIVFRSSEPYFPVFVFIGLNCWNLFSKVVRNSVKLVSNNKSIVTKVFIPKYIFILQKIGVNGFKMIVSFALTAVLMVFYKVPISFRVLWVIPLWILLAIISFAVSSIVMHFGVFVEDLLNVITVVLQFGFYLSGIFYSIDTRIAVKHPTLANLLINLNPVALIITDMRRVLLYNQDPHFMSLAIWFVIATAISVLGIKIIYRYENSYVKII